MPVPSSLDVQLAIQQMMAYGDPNVINNFLAWNYVAHRYGATNQTGARLKHNSTAYNNCNVEPYQSMLPTLVIHWLTFNSKYPLASNHNIAVETVPMPMWAGLLHNITTVLLNGFN